MKNWIQTTIALAILGVLAWQPVLSVQAQESEKKENNVRVNVVDGKVIVKLDNGEVHEFELDEQKQHRSIIMKKQESSDQDDQEVEAETRAILVGPEGKYQVLLDTDVAGVVKPEGALVELVPQLWMSAKGQHDSLQLFDRKGFQIGVHCEPVGETLASHLGLKHGLVVQNVFDESPATQADLKKHDILLTAGGEKLSEINDLVKAIQQAGESEESLKLTGLRSGDEFSAEVTPEKRSGPNLRVDARLKTAPGLSVQLEGMPGKLPMLGKSNVSKPHDLEIRRVLPGWIESKQGATDLKKEIAELRKMIKELQEEIRDK